MVKILIVDRQRGVRNSLKERLRQEGYMVESFEELQPACDFCAKMACEIVICEDDLFYEHISSENNEMLRTAVIVTAAAPSMSGAVTALRSGALDFIPKPIDMNYLLSAVKRIAEHPYDHVPHTTYHAPRPRPRNAQKVEHIVGNSEAINHVKALVDKVAPSGVRVLITGPNGTGKELVAHWLHEKSPRRDGPFIEVNCAAIPSELIESELFGHEKGAFTSAVKQRKGKFEQADGGTLFLDEIGDMSLLAQSAGRLRL